MSMGLSLSLLSWARIEVMRNKILPSEEVEVVLMKSLSFGEKEVKMTLRSLSFKRINSPKKTTPDGCGEVVLQKSLSFKNWEHEDIDMEPCPSFKDQVQNDAKLIPCPSFKDQVQNDTKLRPCPSFKDQVQNDTKLEGLQPLCFKTAENHALHEIQSPQRLLEFSSPRPLRELDAAAVKLQKCYKSYRTRRNLADCAVVVEELWWKALDFASLKRSSVSFFNIEKQETAISRWARARTRAAKVGKGLSKDEKAQKLALQHWLEAIDPRHRYGHNLHFYYDIWFDSESTEPFFYWLDVGDGREVNLEKCTRSRLQQQCIKYLGPKEREAYEVIVEYGKLVYKQNGSPVNTIEGSKWIFVLSPTRTLYVGQKQKGTFQHSSFLAGAATTAAGRLVANAGVLQAIWPYSGHYLPTEENFKEFISFLQDNDVDLSNVKRCSVDDDEYPSMKKQDNEQAMKVTEVVEDSAAVKTADEVMDEEENSKSNEERNDKGTQAAFELGRHLSCKWTTGAGPRIGCVRDYPTELQFKALEQVNLSPRLVPSPVEKMPIPSPRPSPNVRLSPRLSYMGIPTPKVSLTLPQHKWRTNTENNARATSPSSAARMASVAAV